MPAACVRDHEGVTWLARYLTGRDRKIAPVPERASRRKAREAREEFVAHERAIAENARLRRELEKTVGPEMRPRVVPWWEQRS